MKNLNSRGRRFRIFSLLFFTFIVNSFTMFGQQSNFECAVVNPLLLPESSCNQSGSASDAVLNSFDPIVVNVKFWGINRPNGNNDFPNREEETLTAIANLNIGFNKYKVYFKYKGYEEFDSPIHYWDMDGDGIDDPDTNGFYVIEQPYAHVADLEEWASNNGKKDANAMNIYLFGWGSGFGGIGGHPDRFTTALKSDGLTAPLMLHELGHALTLKHTRSSIENVTREEFLDPPYNTIPNLDFNAKTKGDRVEDTAANKGFSQGGNYPFINFTNCSYVSGIEVDNTGAFYVPTPDDVSNILSDAYPCIDFVVSQGQGIRVREALACGDYDPAIGTISSLYEPYKGEYYLAGPLLPEHKPLFQPGFNYYFLECDCDCDVPSDYNDVSFSYTSNIVSHISPSETNYSSITHPNHTAIGIKVEFEPIFWPQPRKCYDNYNWSPKGGKVTRFNDGVFNANVSITPKDSTAINDPNLINNLPNGLYAIEKDFEDGSTEQIVVQKNNNN